MKRIYVIPESGRFSILPVDCARAENLRDARIVERIKSLVIVSHLIKVQHYAVVLGKHRDNSVDECIAKYSVRIAYADDITAANGNAEVIHHVLMVITILRHIEHDPLIDSHGTVFNQHVLELLGLTTIIFNPNQLIIL